MPRSVEEIAADFDALTVRDFDYYNTTASGCERLYELCNEMRGINEPAASAPVMFRTMERLDGVELGNPGPLVHTLESWPGGYLALLAESVGRKPVSLSVWMVNRILNANPPNSHMWLGLLRSVADCSTATEETKAAAEMFVRYQTRA